MLSKKVLDYLENEPKLLLENQEKYKKILEDNGIKKDSDFYAFMSEYGGDMDGSLGYIINVPEDLSQNDNSITNSFHKNEGLSDNFISLFNYEYDDYLLYNKDDDSVIFIEGGNINRLNKSDYNKKWDSFNSFLEDFFE